MKNKTDSKILFITPGASRAGGNIFLFNFLKWFKQNSDIPFLTVYGHGGELEEDFKSLSKTFKFNYEPRPESFYSRTTSAIFRRVKWRERLLARQIATEKINLIYANAVTNHQILAALPDLRAPVISHCHELESVIHRTGLAGFEQTKKRTSHFIAVSEAVRKNLIENHGVPFEKISLAHGFIPIESFSAAELEQKNKKIRRQLGIPGNAFVVGASGTMYWRKAPEIFVQIAAAVHRLKPDLPIYFLWVGGAEKGDFRFFEMEYDVKKLGLEKYVRFLEHKPNPMEYYAALDVFAMVSREDPYPLVCLETASLGKPIICFADAGGMPEFVENDSGFIVSYLDIEAFAGRISELYANPGLREKMGARAALKVRERHDILTSAPGIVRVINKVLNG
ncbi:MAG TPA: glycosyltransferase family 4 protein [Pyrinomonadaceae bacterium]